MGVQERQRTIAGKHTLGAVAGAASLIRLQIGLQWSLLFNHHHHLLPSQMGRWWGWGSPEIFSSLGPGQ